MKVDGVGSVEVEGAERVGGVRRVRPWGWGCGVVIVGGGRTGGVGWGKREKAGKGEGGREGRR